MGGQLKVEQQGWCSRSRSLHKLLGACGLHLQLAPPSAAQPRTHTIHPQRLSHLWGHDGEGRHATVRNRRLRNRPGAVCSACIVDCW